MQCKKCFLRLSYSKTPTITECTICGLPLIPDAQDILEHGMYELAREVRPAQVRMAMDIEKLYTQDDGVLLAEGGTGIGKSFAYLIPSLLQTGKRVVVSTAKTALQDQLVDKDIPLLLSAMGIEDKKCGIYKGRNNYGCRMLVKAAPKNEQDAYDRFLKGMKGKPADKKYWRGPDPKWWGDVNAKNCPLPKGCRHARYCTTKPSDMDIVVTNHSLVGIDLMLGPGTLLGGYDTLILDEGHQAPKFFRDAFSKDVKESRMSLAAKRFTDATDLQSYITSTEITRVSTCVAEFTNLVNAYDDFSLETKKASDRVGRVNVRQLGSGLAELSRVSERLASKLFLVAARLEAAIKELQDGGEKKKAKEERLIGIMSTLNQINGALDKTIKFCNKIDLTAPTAQLVTRNDKGVYVQPLEIGPVIAGPMAKISHKIVVSATLAIGKDFSGYREELGLSKVDAREEIYESPFNLGTQAVLYIPQDMPLPSHRGQPNRSQWIAETATRTGQLLEITKGNAFVLFSARADMDDYITYLNDHGFWESSGLNLCVQGAVASQTLDKFMKTPRSVIFGLKNFWEGIDVPGNKLRSVIITKLPFPHPDDPVYAARRDLAGSNWFFKLSVPPMLMDMRQGLGRLLRSCDDRGFATILDPRVWTGTSKETEHNKRMELYLEKPNTPRHAGYARRLLDILGFNQVTRDVKDVNSKAEEWFGQG